MKKKVVVWVVVVLIVVSSLYLFWPRKAPGYSQQPEDWIEDIGYGVEMINVEEVTEGAGYINDIGQQYNDGNVMTVFSFDGLYEGEYFADYYEDEDGEVLLKIHQFLEPRDGVIEAFFVEKIEDDEVYAYIFLDEDWKLKMPDSNILWGKDFQNSQKFDFSQKIKEGVYMNKIKDDIERFENNFREHEGGIAVGNADSEDVKEGRTKGLTLARVI